ncbi:BnaC01g43390D [Brassica napus]|uniref:BnaC01g43390D protein n=1 Tax=Brassica napus TaxID=3708 RepID=A0A078IFN2_BRANA|nr:BnaC01g43390D [Brassica napus]
MNIETENIPRKLEGKFGAMVVCCILGVGQLVAWNTILTISDYYYQVFPEYHPLRVLTLVYQPFVLGTIFILVFMGKKKKNQKQIAIGYTIFFIGSLLLIILDVATKGEGTLLAYIFLCSIVACFGMANAHVEGAMLGELSFMCPEFIQSFVAGLGVAGAITSALRLVTKAAFDKSPNGLRKGALLFLAFSTLIEFICMVLYIYMFPKLPIVKHYYAKAESNHNTGEHKLGSWHPLVLVASYNVWDAFSRYIPLSKHLKIESIKWITSCVLVRFLFVPAFYFTAQSADQGWMVLLTSLLGLTNGYLTVCILANKPKSKYNVLETDALGNLLVSFMLGGIFAETIHLINNTFVFFRKKNFKNCFNLLIIQLLDVAADFLAYVGAKVCQIFVEVVAQDTTGWIREKMAKAVAEVAFREGGHLTP